MSSYEEALKHMQEEWAMSQGQYEQQFGGEAVPPGLYIAKLQSAKIKVSKSSGKLMVSREHLLTEGEHTGKVIYDQLMLSTAKNLVYVRQWIDMMGYECPEDVTTLEPTVQAISDEHAFVKITIVDDGDFRNVTVTEVLGVGDETQETPQTQTTRKPATTTQKQESGPKEYVLEDLINFCNAVGIELKGIDADDAEAVMNAIQEYVIPAESLTPEFKEMLIAIGLEGIIDTSVSNAEADQIELKNELVQFCIGQAIKFDNDDTVEQLTERIDAFEYPEDKLTDDEKALLVKIGLEGDIKKVETPPPPKRPVSIKKASPSPSKTSLGKSGKSNTGRPLPSSSKASKGTLDKKLGGKTPIRRKIK